MVKTSLVRSFYNNMLVTCYEYEGKKYVANQHGNYDVYEGEYERDKRSGVVKAQSEEMKKIIALAVKARRR